MNTTDKENDAITPRPLVLLREPPPDYHNEVTRYLQDPCYFKVSRRFDRPDLTALTDRDLDDS